MKTIQRKNRNRIYREAQQARGLVRIEFQVKPEVKARFEEAAAVEAETYTEPWDHRRRLTKARTALFEKLAAGTLHQFEQLKEENESLKAQITALSPSFFKSTHQSTPLPNAITALPNDPAQLKRILAALFQESQKAKRDLLEWKGRANQYCELYETSSNQNDELRQKIKAYEA